MKNTFNEWEFFEQDTSALTEAQQKKRRLVWLEQGFSCSNPSVFRQILAEIRSLEKEIQTQENEI